MKDIAELDKKMKLYIPELFLDISGGTNGNVAESYGLGREDRELIWWTNVLLVWGFILIWMAFVTPT